MTITLEQVANIRRFLEEEVEVELNSGKVINGEWTDVGLDSSCNNTSDYNGVYVGGKFYKLNDIKEVRGK